jgi:hypothetical protein
MFESCSTKKEGRHGEPCRLLLLARRFTGQPAWGILPVEVTAWKDGSRGLMPRGFDDDWPEDLPRLWEKLVGGGLQWLRKVT